MTAPDWERGAVSTVQHDSAHLALSHRRLSAPVAVSQASAAVHKGWGGVWAPEFLGLDALALMAVLAHTTRDVRLGTCIVPITTRSPALLAMAASTVAQLAPMRFTLGLGVSTPEIVGRRHARPVSRPVAEMSAVVDVVRSALAGSTVNRDADPAIDDLRIEPPTCAPGIIVAALGPRMTELAYRSGDGALLNLQSHRTVKERVAADPGIVAGGKETVVVVRVCVEPTPDDMAVIRKELVGYSRVQAYIDTFARQQISFDSTAEIPDLKTAAAALSDDVVDALVIHGSRSECRAQVRAFADLGVVPVLLPVGSASSAERVVHRLDPAY